MNKVAIVTGGTSGIGKATADILKSKGIRVYEFSRRQPVEENGIFHITADVTDELAVKNAVNEVFEKEGRIDILINNAGFGISGAVEFTKNEAAKRLMDTNLFGAVNMMRAVIPIMRSAGFGRIVNLSSVASVAPIPFQAWYSISKAGVNMLTMAAANELKPFGIIVCAVLPGDIKTGFTAAREKNEDGDGVYSGRIAACVGVMEKDEQNGMEPAAAGEFIARIALKKKPKVLNTIGFSYKLSVFLLNRLPKSAANYLIGKLYKAL